MEVPRFDVLGVEISAVDMDVAVAEIARWIATGDKHYVCVTGVHGVMESQRDANLKRIHNTSGMTTPDGMPLVWAGWWAGFRDVTRVYGPDLMLAVSAQAAVRGWSFYLYGGKDGIVERLAARLRARFRGLRIAGVESPPFRTLTADEDAAIVRRINDVRPDIVWVGLSTPKQERWMAAHIGRVSAPVLIGVGAAFDIHAGALRQAPRWMQRSGLEWAFRLGAEPRRLAGRYLRNNPRFIAGVVRRPPRRIPTRATAAVASAALTPVAQAAVDASALGATAETGFEPLPARDTQRGTRL
jgi:N-acetylglucosaminyldiphosphoundecaprenol N-acetyl-beta-D-mannosaminyltransferase